MNLHFAISSAAWSALSPGGAPLGFREFVFVSQFAWVKIGGLRDVCSVIFHIHRHQETRMHTRPDNYDGSVDNLPFSGGTRSVKFRSA